MKNDREMMEALLAGETLLNKDGSEWYLDKEDGYMEFLGRNRFPQHWAVEIKQKTININGFCVPEPLRGALNKGDFYYLVEFSVEIIKKIQWENDERDIKWITLGICHRTKEAAELHRKALLSFTEVEK
jgi:hypothetical protein